MKQLAEIVQAADSLAANLRNPATIAALYASLDSEHQAAFWDEVGFLFNDWGGREGLHAERDDSRFADRKSMEPHSESGRARPAGEGGSMSQFKFEEIDGQPDRSFVEVDGKYSVVIIRTDEGLIVDVWPTDWDVPINSLAVHDHDAIVEEEVA